MRRKQSTLRRSSATESSEEDDPINQDIPPAHGYGEHRNIRGDVDDAAVFQGSEWTQTANSTAETRIGVCMSGNELYDSMFSLGVLNSLLARSVRIDFLSTVDAGSFVASSYLRWKDREGHQNDTLLWQEYYFRRQCVAYQKIATENGDPRPRPFASGFFGNLVLLGFVFMVMLLPIVELSASVFARCLYVATSWVYPQCRENNVHGGIFLTLLSTVVPLAGHMLLVLAKKVRVSAFGESLVRNAAAKLFVLTAVFLQTFSLVSLRIELFAQDVIHVFVLPMAFGDGEGALRKDTTTLSSVHYTFLTQYDQEFGPAALLRNIIMFSSVSIAVTIASQ